MQKQKKVLKGVAGFLGAGLLLLGLKGFQGSIGAMGSKSFNLSSLPGVPEATSQTLRDTRRSSWTPSGLSDAMLIDSILTIVQNYYVDEARVDNQLLIEAALKALSEQDLIKLRSMGSGHWVVTEGNETTSFEVSGTYSYEQLAKDYARLAQILDRHKNSSAVPTKPEQKGAFVLLNAMLSGLDPHSNLLNQEEYRDLRQGTEGSFGGLGVVVGMQDDVLTVIKPLPKSPAARAGVVKSDRIMQIDSKSTFGTTLDDLIQYMRGDPGTRVNLFVLREGDNAPRQMSLMREIIQVDSVESKIIASPQGPVFYANIDSFSSRTAAELRDALLKAQQKNEGLSGIVLDMRSNPGGLLDQAVKVADLFLDEGRIVSTQGRTREYEVAKQNLYRFDYPIMILTNGDTASASEIVAGALRDHGRALVIGEPSFGKGSVQTVFELPGDQALKLTIARYFTPRGISIQNVGIVPDIWLQPLYAGNINKNLLGEYRYKSERFLEHSLDQDKVRSASLPNEWKAYYLDKIDSGKKQKDDIPLNFAVKLIEDLALRDGVPMPVERLRASYWKASSSKILRKMLKDLNQSAEAWLTQNQKVDWSEDGEEAQLAAEKRLRFLVDVPDRQQLMEGKAVEIPWKMRNNSNKTLHRLSVFATGNHNAVSTTEVLVGSIQPGQEIQGTLHYEMKIDAKETPLRLRVGLARSGWPLSGKDKNFWVDLEDSQEPDYSLNLTMSQEKGGRVKGVLEGGESAQIELTVKNNSSVLAHQIEIRLVNLAGNQILLEGPKYRLKQLAPGEARTLRYALKASVELASSQVQLGALISSQEQLGAKKSHFFISSEPVTRMSKMDVSTGSEPWKEN